MARHGSRLLANGFTILPIAPGGKKPGRYQRGVWVDYPEWNRHAERPTTEVEVATWSGLQIPRSSRPLFRDEAGRDSDMMPATIPR